MMPRVSIAASLAAVLLCGAAHTAAAVSAPIAFGAMLTDSSIAVGFNLSDADILMSLEGLASLRLSVGPSDFSPTNYDWHTTDGDGVVDPFVKDTKLPFLKRVIHLRPDLTFFAAPWAPPRAFCNGKSNKPCTWTKFDAVWYSNVLVSWVQHYAAHGVAIEYLSLQNEPMMPGKGAYPNMFFTAAQLAELRAAVAQRDASLKVIVLDHNPTDSGFQNGVRYVRDIVAAGGMQVGDVVGWHLYAGTLNNLAELSPRQPCFVTEISAQTSDEPASSTDWYQARICEAVAQQCTRFYYMSLWLDAASGPNIRPDSYKQLPMYTVTDGKVVAKSFVAELFGKMRAGEVTC